MEEIELTLENIEQYRAKIFKQITIYHNVQRGCRENLEKIEDLERGIEYCLMLQDIQDIK